MRKFKIVFFAKWILCLIFLLISTIFAVNPSLGVQKGFLYDGIKFTTIDVPGAQDTLPMGINDAGMVAGYYIDSKSKWGGFLFDGVNYIIDPILQVNALFLGINDKGQTIGLIVGSLKSFVSDGNNITYFNVPGADETFPRGINDSGIIVGSYSKKRGDPRRAFVFDGVNYTYPNVPGITGPGDDHYSECTGINDAGLIVGFTNARQKGGFIFDGINYTFLDKSRVRPTGINDTGKIVGQDLTGGHGILFDGINYTGFDVPGPSYNTGPTGINDSGVIVGHFTYATPVPSAFFLLGTGLLGIATLIRKNEK